jgi:RNA polymerase sigma-70 factor (ECF subfamily)
VTDDDAAGVMETTAVAAREPADVVTRYGDLVFNLAVRLTGDREEARDLAQDALIRILRGVRTFRGDASMTTWIYRIVINCHRNRLRWWRRRGRGATLSLDAPADPAGHDPGMTLGATVPDPAAGPDRRAEAARAGERLQRALMALPRDQRAAIVLREIEGLSYQEIAGALGVREGTVKSRIARAREALRAALSDLALGRS